MTTPTQDLAQQAAALSDMARRGDDIGEAALTIGQAARTQGDAFRFILGEVANTLTVAYGEATMATWAKAVKIGSLSTARHYARITATLGLARCIEYLALDISYSFMRKVVFSLGDDAPAYLDTFAAMPVGSEPPPLPKTDNPRPIVFLDIQDARICDVNVSGGFIVLNVGNGAVDLANLPRDVEYHLIIKEVRK